MVNFWGYLKEILLICEGNLNFYVKGIHFEQTMYAMFL